jgi:hypothetical protein
MENSSEMKALTKEQKQDFFNRAVAGLASQGFERAISDGNCAYRGENGRKCAIGHLMPDGLYEPRFENKRAEPFGAVGIGSVDFQWACELQRTHDLGTDPEHMREHLRYFAVDHELEIPEVLR